MELGQTCKHGNVNGCIQGCFNVGHEDAWTVTLEITIQATSRDNAFEKVETLLPYPLKVVLYDAEIEE